jgi:hypothetical protein
MERMLFVMASILATLWMAACEDNGGDDDSSDAGTSNGGGELVPQDCDDAFTMLESPYMADNTVYEMVVADGAGLVVAPIVDPSQLSDPNSSGDFPVILETVDMNGNVQTIYSQDSGMIMSLAADASTVYIVTVEAFGGDLIGVPRAGGAATVQVDGGVWEGPVICNDTLYYATQNEITRFAPADGTSTVLSDRGTMLVGAMTCDRESLYWTESTGVLGDDEVTIYRLSLADNSVETIATMLDDLGVSRLFVGGGELYIAGLVDMSMPLRRVVPGGDLVLVAETNGVIAFSEDSAYYSTSRGLIETPLDFSVTTELSETTFHSLFSVAVGPDHVWYSDRGCIYRLTR